MSKTVLVVALDQTDGTVNILFGNGIEVPNPTKPGDIIKVSLGGGMSIPILTTMFLTTLRTAKDQAMKNPQLKPEDIPAFEQEIYDMLNMSVGSFLDTEFPNVNSMPCLTEEACVEYGLDPKQASAEEVLAAENKFIEEFPERAAQCREMIPTKPEKFDGSNGGPNRKERREKKRTCS